MMEMEGIYINRQIRMAHVHFLFLKSGIEWVQLSTKRKLLQCKFNLVFHIFSIFLSLVFFTCSNSICLSLFFFGCKICSSQTKAGLKPDFLFLFFCTYVLDSQKLCLICFHMFHLVLCKSTNVHTYVPPNLIPLNWYFSRHLI
jgi:hypothetical protein